MIRRSSKCVANLSTWIKILLDSLTGRKKLVFRRQFLDCEKCNFDIFPGDRRVLNGPSRHILPLYGQPPPAKMEQLYHKIHSGQVPYFLSERICEGMKSESIANLTLIDTFVKYAPCFFPQKSCPLWEHMLNGRGEYEVACRLVFFLKKLIFIGDFWRLDWFFEERESYIHCGGKHHGWLFLPLLFWSIDFEEKNFNGKDLALSKCNFRISNEKKLTKSEKS